MAFTRLRRRIHSATLPKASGSDTAIGPLAIVAAADESSLAVNRRVFHDRQQEQVDLNGSSDTCVALKGVAQGLSALARHHEQLIPNKDDFRRILLRTESLFGSFAGPAEDDVAEDFEQSSLLKSKLDVILATLGVVLQPDTSNSSTNADTAERIVNLLEDVRDAIMDYQTSLQLASYHRGCQIMDPSIYLFSSATPSDQVDNSSSGHKSLLGQLIHASGADHLSGNRRKCWRGTRTQVIRDIEGWAEDRNNGRVYWLNGVAGCGKSTIAKTFADYAFAEGQLGACFFCSRDFADRSDLKLIFPTLAFELAHRNRDFRARLAASIKSMPNIGSESLSLQLEKLLIEPLKSIGMRTIIIIDALDECKDDEPASAVLSLLARHIDEIPSVKFFITGRPEPRIRSGFRLPLLRPHTEVFLLHRVDPKRVDRDIETFLKARLSDLAFSKGYPIEESHWPTDNEVATLVHKSDGLFIYADTILKMVSVDDSPRDRLRLIVSMPDSTSDEGSSGIDALYDQIIDESYVSQSSLERQRLILAIIVLIFNPLSRASLATLLDVGPQVILTSLRSLHSLLLVPISNSHPIRTFHKSFPDYLTDPSRCRNPRFCVNPSVYHVKIAILCLELMQKRLKKNICNLPPRTMNKDVEDLPTCCQKYIGDAVQYACRFWARHLGSATGADEHDVSRILELLNEFVQNQLLAWLEVLSVAQDLGGSVLGLLSVEGWLLVFAPNSSLLKSIHECRRFVLHSFDCIKESVPHMYDSALLWPPAASFVRKFYEGQATTHVKALNAVATSWDSCVRSIKLGDGIRVESVAFSHNGDLIAGGGEGGALQIAEAATGVCLAKLDARNEHVKCIAFSIDDMLLASGSYGYNIMIWDVQTGAFVTQLEGHTSWVNSVAFSPSGTVIASTGNDRTIRIWNISSGCCQQVLKGHSGHIHSLCWSGVNEIISGSMDKSVKVWNVSKGTCSKTFREYNEWVSSVAFSPDSSKFASGSNNTIKIYDAKTGHVLQIIHNNSSVESVCFSPDGNKIVYSVYAGTPSVFVQDLVKGVTILKCGEAGAASVAFAPDGSCVASASGDGFVKIWQLEANGHDYDAGNQHSGKVWSVSFMAEGRMIASGSADQTVKLWDPVTGSCLHTFRGHSGWVNSVTFSPNTLFVASGAGDKTVRIWSIPTGGWTVDPCIYTFRGHSDWVNSVAFSMDNSLLASGSIDKTVRIWSVHDHSLIRTLKGDSPLVRVSFSHDGQSILSLSFFDEIIVWNVKRGERLAVLHSDTMNKLSTRINFSADGTCVILNSGDVVRRWDVVWETEQSGVNGVGSPRKNLLHRILKMIRLYPWTKAPHWRADQGHLISHALLPQLYHYKRDGEWIMDQQNMPVCWIAPDRRGLSNDVHGKKVVLGTRSGRVVVLDFSDMPS